MKISLLACLKQGFIVWECRSLRELDLRESEVEDLSGHWLSHFPDNYTSLVSLNISCLVSEVSFSALERLVGRCPNLKSLRLNRAVPVERIANLLRRAPQLTELGTGSYSAELRPDVYSNLAGAVSSCKELRGLSGLWDAVPAYLPALYSACHGITTLNLSYSAIQSPELIKLLSQCQNLQRLWVYKNIWLNYPYKNCFEFFLFCKYSLEHCRCWITSRTPGLRSSRTLARILESFESFPRIRSGQNRTCL